MPEKKGAHLGFDDRREIEDMLKEGGSFREIARKLKVSPTTVSNEVRLNRTFSKPKAVPQKAQARCSRYKDCRKVMLCRACASRASACKRCGRKRCWGICPGFDPWACGRRERAHSSVRAAPSGPTARPRRRATSRPRPRRRTTRA